MDGSHNLCELKGRQARRKPRLLFLLSGLLLFRLPTVQLFALLFQLPPRLTRLVPDAAPYKIHTVFLLKNFRAAKAATQCSFIFASKNVLHRIYTFVLWQVRRYGRLTLRPPLLTRLRTNV